MRILIATSCRGIVGGVETYLQILIPALLERKHEIALMCDYLAASGPTVDPPEARLPQWESRNFVQNPDRWKEVDAWKPDVVYSHILESSEVEKELQERYPAVVFVHTYRGTCATGRKCHAFPRLVPCNRTLGPMCLVLHYPRRCGGLNPLTAWRGYAREMAVKSGFANYREVLVASNHMRREMEKHGVSPDRMQLTPLPLVDAGRTPPPAAKVPQGRLLFAGRLVDVKGADFFVRAIPKAARQLGRPLTLVVAGDGAERAKLEDLARQLGVTLEFAGWVGGEQKRNLMRQADLIAVPSLWPEPFGLVGIEAGCQGTPAVGYAVGGIPDWLIPGVSGELAPGDPPTVDGLADAIVRALADTEHYRKLCKGAWETANRFSLERHLARLEPILEANAGLSPAMPELSGVPIQKC